MSDKSQIANDAPFPASRKVFVEGRLPGVRVAMREVSLSPTRTAAGATEPNGSIRLYDTSGPYTDPSVRIDVRQIDIAPDDDAGAQPHLAHVDPGAEVVDHRRGLVGQHEADCFQLVEVDCHGCPRSLAKPGTVPMP